MVAIAVFHTRSKCRFRYLDDESSRQKFWKRPCLHPRAYLFTDDILSDTWARLGKLSRASREIIKPMPKSWNEKFESKSTHNIKVIEKDFWSQKAGDRMLIPTPKLIEDYVNQSEKGKSIDPIQMRIDLAAELGADFTCPMTTGIFTRIMAEKNLEVHGENYETMTPFWRLVEPKSDLVKKLSCGKRVIQKLREDEGF